MAYSGFLLKIGSWEFPESLMAINSYSPYVNMQDVDPWTDENGELHRNPIDLKAIIFGSIIVGAIGAIMDVSIDIASALNEVINASEKPSFEKTIKAGFEIECYPKHVFSIAINNAFATSLRLDILWL